MWFEILAIFLFFDLTYQSVSQPVLKYSNKACDGGYCQGATYSSPWVGDLDNDGILDIVSATYSITRLNATNGATIWWTPTGFDTSSDPNSNSPVGRTWASVAVADLDHDGIKEIVVGHNNGYLSVYTPAGRFKPGFPIGPSFFQTYYNGGDTSHEIRSVKLVDLDKDGTIEIIVGVADNDYTTAFVFEPNGSLRSGWPQSPDAKNQITAGIYNDAIVVADIVSGGNLEIVTPLDQAYIPAWKSDGTSVPANSIFSVGSANAIAAGINNWGTVPTYVNYSIEIRAYGDCSPTGDGIKVTFANGCAAAGDIDGDGTLEIVVAGNAFDAYNCNSGATLYMAGLIFNTDRSRWSPVPSKDWTQLPVSLYGGGPLDDLQGSTMLSAQPNVVLGDLDGDGTLEILYPSFDGYLHCLWADKTVKYNWPYKVTGSVVSYASEPLLADLDNDGKVEVIFTTITAYRSNTVGGLYIIDYKGSLLQSVSFTLYRDCGKGTNGGLAAPTLANIDSDDDLEIVINTFCSGVWAYDLPGTANARVVWGTGRSNSTTRNPNVFVGQVPPPSPPPPTPTPPSPSPPDTPPPSPSPPDTPPPSPSPPATPPTPPDAPPPSPTPTPPSPTPTPPASTSTGSPPSNSTGTTPPMPPSPPSIPTSSSTVTGSPPSSPTSSTSGEIGNTTQGSTTSVVSGSSRIVFSFLAAAALAFFL